MYKNVLIVGANFNNKGAQSMLFITMDEIKKRLPDAKIYFASSEIGELSNYKFEYLYISKESKSIALHRNVPIAICKAVVKDTIKTLIGKGTNSWKFLKLKNLMNEINIIIDVSGFNLGRKWDVFTHEYYLDNIRLAKEYNIPIYIMPQSFGPFDYPANEKFLIDEMAELLPYVSQIFAREKEGFQMLMDTFHLKNVMLSADLVLQNKAVDFGNIYKIIPKINVPITKVGAVGIIPNRKCFEHGNKKKNIIVYQAVIELLLKKDKEIYIFQHSSDDSEICKEIFGMINNEHIHLLDNDFSCFEYDVFVKQFDFIICSRYHGVVHAYRNCIPAILLGWAVKYLELAELVGQREYSFDFTDEQLKTGDIVKAVEKMCEQYLVEQKNIEKQIELIQNSNCFEKVFEE